jgi:hypothetical protein
MALPLLATLGKAYLTGKAKDYASAKAEDALGLPKDSIALLANPTGFAKNIAKGIATDYAKDAFMGRDAIPEEDRSFTSGGKEDRMDTMEYEGDYKRGGKVKPSKASSRGDGIAKRGKTRGKYI